MSDQTPQINLISVLPEIAKTKLSSDSYGFLEYYFGLDDAVSLEKMRENIASLDSKVELKKLLAAFSSLSEAFHQDEKAIPIIEELQLLKADLLGSKNYVDNFNTEEKLISRLKSHYNFESLTVAQTGIALITFYLLEFKRIDITGCQIIWKLTDNDVTSQMLETLHQTIMDILSVKPNPIEVNDLRRRIAEKNRSKKLPDEALLRFILSIDPTIEIIKEQGSVQITFAALKLPQLPYRVLLENGKPMKTQEIEEEVRNRLKPFGKALPAIKNYLSTYDWYIRGSEGWGLEGWEMKKNDEILDLLKSWFQETKTPATRVEMVNYLQPLRPDLKSIYNMIGNYEKEIVKVQYVQADLKPRGKAELFYHAKVTLPEGVKRVKNSAKPSSASASSSKLSKAPKLFVSYAHANNKWLKEFKRHLEIYHQQNILNVWTDTSIMAGEDWDKSIKNALKDAKGILFLVTPEFLTSKYITAIELPKLLKRASTDGARIFWVLVEDCDFNASPLAKLQAAHATRDDLWSLVASKRNSAISEICKRIKDDITSPT